MPILIVKPKTLNPEKVEELRQAGYYVIETDNPADVQVLDEFTTAKRDMVLEAALQSLDWGNDPTCRNAFGKLLREKLMDKLGIKSITQK